MMHFLCFFFSMDLLVKWMMYHITMSILVDLCDCFLLLLTALLGDKGALIKSGNSSTMDTWHMYFQTVSRIKGGMTWFLVMFPPENRPVIDWICFQNKHYFLECFGRINGWLIWFLVMFPPANRPVIDWIFPGEYKWDAQSQMIGRLLFWAMYILQTCTM